MLNHELELGGKHMKAKEFLSQVRSLDVSIQNKLDELEKLRDKTKSVTSPWSDEEPVQHTRNVHALEQAIARIVDLEEEIASDIAFMQVKRAEVMDVISKAGDWQEERLLYLRYFKHECWEKIAVTMNISIRHVYRLHGRALQDIEAYLESTRIHSKERSD